MKIRFALIGFEIAGILILFSGLAIAQAPAPAPAPTPPPEREYSGSFGAGLTLTGGNTTTRNYNLSFSHKHQRMNGNFDKITALYLRGKENDVLNLDRASVTFRDEYNLSRRVFLFGEADYLSDRFKDISYFISPFGGIGYKLIDTDRTKLQLSGGAGGIWEKNSGVDVGKSGSVNAGQTYLQKISTSSEFTESVSALWKMNDYSDSLTIFSTGLTTSISKKFELKVEFLDTFKNKPPNASIKKNDTSFVLTFLMKY